MDEQILVVFISKDTFEVKISENIDVLGRH
jgi:hypothetical protein